MLVLEFDVLIILSEEIGVSHDDGWLKDVRDMSTSVDVV